MREFLKANSTLLLNWLTGICLALQIMNLHTYVAHVVDHQSIVASVDDDASWNIRKTVSTRWWKDNGWVLYGPLYFRLNHSLQYFWQRTADPAPLGEAETWERTAHTAVMTTSLLSLAALCLLLSSALLADWWARFITAMALLSALLHSQTWDELILRAHPDHMFSLCVAAALWLTCLMLDKPQDSRWRKLSATLWGFAMSIKMTLTLCTPGFVLLFIPRWREGLRYLGVMILAYFLIGFPQTIVLDRPFRDLKTLQDLGISPTWTSLTHWLAVFAEQLGAPLAVLLLAALCFKPRREGARVHWRIWVFVGLPFLILLTKNQLLPADHYAMPFVAMLLTAVSLGLARVPAFAALAKRSNHKLPIWRSLIFVTLALVTLGTTPTNMQTELTKRLHCRNEAREVYGRLLGLYQKGAKVWVDPYTPYVSQADKAHSDVEWQKTWNGYKSGGWTAFALNTEYMQKFLGEPDSYIKTVIPEWAKVKEFYQVFSQGTRGVSPDGATFERTYQDDCHMQIWELKSSASAAPGAAHDQSP